MPHATAPDGTRIAYQVQGRGTGTPLVLLSGQSNSHHWWDSVRADFDASRTTVTLDPDVEQIALRVESLRAHPAQGVRNSGRQALVRNIGEREVHRTAFRTSALSDFRCDRDIDVARPGF